MAIYWDIPPLTPEEEFSIAADCSPPGRCEHNFEDRPCQTQMYLEALKQIELLKSEIEQRDLVIEALVKKTKPQGEASS
ncbi:Uncharacterised protein [uncultured archaeon]|nr:Uncharacterised protein [uncultured archaeon]